MWAFVRKSRQRVHCAAPLKSLRVGGRRRLCRLSNDDRAWVRKRGIGAAAHRVGVKGTRCPRVRRRRWPVARPRRPRAVNKRAGRSNGSTTRASTWRIPRAIGAAFELARWERDEKRAEILKRVKDAADSGAWIEAEEDEPETTAARASRGASATTRPGPATGDLTPAQAAQLRAQVAAFGRLARGLTVPAGLMTAAAAGDRGNPPQRDLGGVSHENEKRTTTTRRSGDPEERTAAPARRQDLRARRRHRRPSGYPPGRDPPLRRHRGQGASTRRPPTKVRYKIANEAASRTRVATRMRCWTRDPRACPRTRTLTSPASRATPPLACSRCTRACGGRRAQAPARVARADGHRAATRGEEADGG